MPYLRSYSKDHFNYLVTHNAMKWQPCERREGVFSYEDADGAVAWAKANQVPMRGHALLWATGTLTKQCNKHQSSKKDQGLIQKTFFLSEPHPGTQMPNWLDNYSGSELAEKVEKRIEDALSHFNGSLTGWDVNNEMTHGEVLLTNTNDPDIRCHQLLQLQVNIVSI